MRNVKLADFDATSTAVLPIGTDYPPDHLLDLHSHRRAQLLYGATGIMQVETVDGSWTVPTDRAVLIPAETPHQVRMLDVTTWSLYIEPTIVPWWPRRCIVVEVGPLLRELLREASTFEADYAEGGRDGIVIHLALEELQRVTPIPLSVVLPTTEPLLSLSRRYLSEPDAGVTNDEWARASAMSTRTFDRRFRAETGTSPAAWRARARLLASLAMLRRRSVTQVASQLGYSSPAAFTAAFSRAFGSPPSTFH